MFQRVHGTRELMTEALSLAREIDFCIDRHRDLCRPRTGLWTAPRAVTWAKKWTGRPSAQLTALVRAAHSPGPCNGADQGFDYYYDIVNEFTNLNVTIRSSSSRQYLGHWQMLAFESGKDRFSRICPV